MIDNPFEMVVLIVAIVMIAGVLRAKYKASEGNDGISDQEVEALKSEVVKLRDRVKVLERIAIEKEDTLTREIEQLRES